MKCLHCKKEDIEEIDMHNSTMCDDCLDVYMDQEERDFDIYYQQGQMCHLCNKELSSWAAKDVNGARRVVCYTDCNNTASPAIRLRSKDFIQQ